MFAIHAIDTVLQILRSRKRGFHDSVPGAPKAWLGLNGAAVHLTEAVRWESIASRILELEPRLRTVSSPSPKQYSACASAVASAPGGHPRGADATPLTGCRITHDDSVMIARKVLLAPKRVGR